MPTVAIFLSKGGLGDCAQHSVAHALLDESVVVRAIAREASTIGHIDQEKEPFLSTEQLTNARLSQHVIPYDSESAEATSQLTAILDGVDAVIAAPSSRQPFKERKAAGSMRAICTAMTSRHVAAKRLVYLSTIGVDSPPMPWSWIGKILSAVFAVARKVRPDFRAADAAVRGSSLDYLIVRPMGVDPSAVARGVWHVLPADDHKGPLEPALAKADVGKYMLEEALRPTAISADLQIGWQPKPAAPQA